MTVILTAEHVSGGYGDRKVLHDVSIQLRDGERLLLIGPNGCGKTTLLKTLAGSLRADCGRIAFQDRNISRLPTYVRMSMGLGYLMQTRNVFQSLSVDENLHLSFWHGMGITNLRRTDFGRHSTVLRRFHLMT